MPDTSVPAARRVLIVEDDGDIRDVLREALETEGYDVVAVGTVADARRELSADGIAAALLDHWLPDGTGADLCRAVKAASARTIPCILFSASPANEALARRAGADLWLTKPFDLDRLVDAVETLRARPSANGG